MWATTTHVRLDDEATAGALGGVTETSKNTYVVIHILALTAVIVGVDVLFFGDQFWPRLPVNIGIVVVFAAFGLRYLRQP